MKFFPKAWVLPGGGVEIKEHFEQSLLREVYEETGISIEKKWVNRASDVTTEGYSFQNLTCIVKPYFAFESCSYKDIDDPSLEPAKSTHLILFYIIQLPVPREKVKLKL